MAVNKVARSIEAPGGVLCVDVFVRPDGSWGFEEYRRDAEDPRGWFPVGSYSGLVFPSQACAEAAAAAAIAWLTSDRDTRKGRIQS